MPITKAKAKQLVAEYFDKDLDRISSAIEDAAMIGNTYVWVDEMRDSTISYLKNDGFKVEKVTKAYSGNYRISWEL